MKKNDNWSQSFAPLNTAECDPVRIAGSVREKINAEKGRNITMKTNKRRIKPLVIAAAVAATAAVSMVSVNAATDGQLVEKISLFINGKEQDIDNSNIKKGVDENGDQYYEFHVNEDTDSEVSVELRGDVPTLMITAFSIRWMLTRLNNASSQKIYIRNVTGS